MDLDAPAMKRQRTADEADAGPKTFTVLLRGVPFILTQDELEFDSPNYFTDCFFSEFTESETRTVRMNRSPSLFPHIQNWLCGYDILPLPAIADMSPAVALANLLKDAQYFGLSKLEELLTTPVFPPVEPHESVLATYAFGPRVTVDDIWSGKVQLDRDNLNFRGGFLGARTNVQRLLPLVGGSEPPLVLIQNANLRLNIKTDENGYLAITATVDTLGRRMDVPAAAPDTPPLIYDGFDDAFRYIWDLDAEGDERPEDAFLSLDGIGTTFMLLGRMMHYAARQLDHEDVPSILTTPLGRLLVEHLTLANSLPSPVMLGPHASEPPEVPFYVFASEVWVVPQQTQQLVDRNLDDDEDETVPVRNVFNEFCFRIVSATCHSMGSGTLGRLAAPISPMDAASAP